MDLPPSNRKCIEALERLEKEARTTGLQHLSFTYGRAIRALRAHTEPIRSGKEAMQLKGIGKFIAEKIDQALQEVRSQNAPMAAQEELGGNVISEVALDDETILPRDLEEWLRGYGMEQHKEVFLANGFENLIVLKELTMSDLEAIGIPLLGHRKTLLLAATELKETFALRQKREQALKAAALRNRVAGTPLHTTQPGNVPAVRDTPMRTPVVGHRKTASLNATSTQELTAENNNEEENAAVKVPRMVVLSGSPPYVTTNFIIHNSSDESYAKGNALFHRCSVLSLVLTGTELCAEIKKGTTYNRKSHLKVTLQIASTGKVNKAVCSCSSTKPGWCKHIVATLICVQKHNELSGEPQGYVRPSSKENKNNRTPNQASQNNSRKKRKADEDATTKMTAGAKSKGVRNKEKADAEDKQKKKKTQRVYIPKYRSGAWALLVALSLVRKDKNSPSSGYLDKKALIDRAGKTVLKSGSRFESNFLFRGEEPLCDSNFYREANSQGGSSGFYTAWNSMGTLISKSLVHRMGSTYGLTEAGAALAKRLKQAAQEFEDESEEEEMNVGVVDGEESGPIDVTMMKGKETMGEKEKLVGEKEDKKETKKNKLDKAERKKTLTTDVSEKRDKGKEKIRTTDKKENKREDCSEEQEDVLVWESSSSLREDYFVAFDSQGGSTSPLFDMITCSPLREEYPSTVCLTFPQKKASPSPSSNPTFSTQQQSPPSPRPLYTLPLPSFDLSPPLSSSSFRGISFSSSSPPEVLVLDVSGDGDEEDNTDHWSPPLTKVKKESASSNFQTTQIDLTDLSPVRESKEKRTAHRIVGEEEDKEKEPNKKRKKSPTGGFKGNERKQRRFSCEFEPDAFSCGTGWLEDVLSGDEGDEKGYSQTKTTNEGKEKIKEKGKGDEKRVRQDKYKIDEIVLLLDNREIHENSVKTLAKRVGEQGVICETRNLALGDVLWVARCSLKKGMADKKKRKDKKEKEKEKEKEKSVFQFSSDESDGELTNKKKRKKKKEIEEEEKDEKEEEEFVLDYIVERKRADDLMASIEDGRYREQKFRLKRCGVPNVIYLIEGSYYGGEPIEDNPLFQEVVLSTHVQDDFFVMRTDNERHTASYLAQVTEMLEEKYLKHRGNKGRNQKDERWKLGEHNVPLSLFNKRVSKSGNLTVSDVFAKQLMQINGCTPERALAIIRNYPTPMALTMAYDELDKNEKKKERLVAAIEVNTIQDEQAEKNNNNNNTRKLGMALSKRMYKLYNEFTL